MQYKTMAVKQQKGRIRSSQHFRAKATNRVDDLQGMVSELQQARREGRLNDVALLEEQMHQMLREWKAELRESSPASSLLQVAAASPCNSELSSDMERLLQLHDEDDDATSKASLTPADLDQQQPYNQDHLESSPSLSDSVVLEAFARLEQTLQEEDDSPPDVQAGASTERYIEDLLQSPPIGPMQNPMVHPMSDRFAMVPPLAAYLHPKCALWDCPRPARGGCEGTFYCSSFHEDLALNEGAPGNCPVVRPGGIDLKDGPLFSALAARVGGHAVGIPELQGAATSKSPWNATDLFDVAVHPGETLREWLFFDKPRRAFESGTRKQRSLPDYGGRGWHESRKQVMKDLGGLKRSYYMDPQPEGVNEWHMYEYELTMCTECALYRLELKQVDASKRSGRVKAPVDTSVASLQHQIGRLPADLSQFEAQTMLRERPCNNNVSSNRGRAKSSSQKRGISKHAGPGPLVSALAQQSSIDHVPFNYTAELQ